ncbi:hypothetical protein DUI87_16390 [Hirundo rustica rustica]|uniref:Uncharacterized protein n=1 Tax=Hirundo rustica rustica TaxID=333673 RepID=A0A3M0K0Y1_HIRRU|nr:hypothetical protein DUI87_16390 [Hirundo rustica rustica]
MLMVITGQGKATRFSLRKAVAGPKPFQPVRLNLYKKSPSVAIKSRQQASHDINKRRTLLQDNSWIKKRPEEESADENYGRAVLNQYKSQDSLHSSSMNEKEDQKAVLGRYRSDTTLDRIPAGNDTDKMNKSPDLNHKQNNRTNSENSEALTRAALSSEQVTPQKSKTDVDDQATARNQAFDNLSKVNSSSFKSDKEIIEKAYENPPRAPNNHPETNYSNDSERKTSKSSRGAYEENITGNTIKTVYSTSDRKMDLLILTYRTYDEEVTIG